MSGSPKPQDPTRRTPTVTVQPSGFRVGAVQVETYTLTSPTGLELRVMTYGGIVLSILAPDREGSLADVALGYASAREYLDNPAYFGAIVGRYANRVGGGRLVIDGAPYQLDRNDGANHLHGGNRGLDAVMWDARPFQNDRVCGVELSCVSPDGHAGYPGNLTVRVIYTLRENEWAVEYHATTDQPTPVNLTQHTYFNLAGSGTIRDHELQVAADRFIPVAGDGIPTGRPAQVENTPFDFRQPRRLGASIDSSNADIAAVGGYDHCFWLDVNDSLPAAKLTDPATGRTLSVFTTEPGTQVYSGNHLNGIPGKSGLPYRARDGVCLETQHFPDSPNRPDFPGTILRPGETFTSRTVFAFGILTPSNRNRNRT
ncbi:MAG: aldose 1-epimerase [Rhodothermales bacterium]|jgi:aldose 1-epimerase